MTRNSGIINKFYTMKKILSIFGVLSLVAVLVFVSCEKSQQKIIPVSSTNQSNNSSSNNDHLQMRTTPCTATVIADSLKNLPHSKLIVRFTLSGSDGKCCPSTNCTGGTCGICLGFCVKKVKKVEKPEDPFGRTVPDYNDYENYVDIYLLNDSTMLMVPYQTFDNGLSYDGTAGTGPVGTVNLSNDMHLPKLTEDQLNLKKLVIKEGIYTIDYGCNDPYGTITVPVIINT